MASIVAAVAEMFCCCACNLYESAVEIDTGRVPELPPALLQSIASGSNSSQGKGARDKDGKGVSATAQRNSNKAGAERRQGKGGRRGDSSGGGQYRAGPSTGMQPNPYQLDAVENFALQADVSIGGAGVAPLSLSDRCE